MFAAYVNICNVSYNFLTINNSLPLNLQCYTYTLWANRRTTFRACSNVQPCCSTYKRKEEIFH